VHLVFLLCYIPLHSFLLIQVNFIWMYCLSICRYHIPRAWLLASKNLLVLFEETGGNPFEISLTTHSMRAICAQISELHYPPLSKWVVDGGKISINDTTPEMHLHCEREHVISIVFSSYGTPRGSCQNYVRGTCHAPTSLEVVSEVSGQKMDRKLCELN